MVSFMSYTHNIGVPCLGQAPIDPHLQPSTPTAPNQLTFLHLNLISINYYNLGLHHYHVLEG